MDAHTMAVRLAEAVQRQGGRTFYVGGCVRDKLRGVPCTDIDVEVHGLRPQQLEEILDGLGQRLTMGMSFGIYGLKGCSLDIAMPRKEHLRGSGHRDFDVCVDPFLGTTQAARRRDFTINAMMEDVLTGELVDPFGGQQDLQAGVLRHVDGETFGEDPLRVLRCAQFAARFGFSVAEETVTLCKTMALSTLSRERILAELEKALLQASTPSVFFEVLRNMGQLSCWFPELEALIGVPQPPRFHGEGDVWNHTMLVLDQAASMRERTAQPLFFLLAALCHDFGKAAATRETDGQLHAYDHETLGIPLAEQFLRRLTDQRDLIAYVKNMTELHMKPNILAGANSSVKATNKLFDRSVNPEDLILLALCDDRGRILAEPTPDHEAFLMERLRVFQELMAKPHVLGRDLLDAGLKPGPHFSDILAYAHKLRLAGVDKESALKQTLAYARKL